MWRKLPVVARRVPVPRGYSTHNAGLYMDGALTRRDLAAVNSQATPLGKIREAVRRNLFALASIIALRHCLPPSSPSNSPAVFANSPEGLTNFHEGLTNFYEGLTNSAKGLAHSPERAFSEALPGSQDSADRVPTQAQADFLAVRDNAHRVALSSGSAHVDSGKLPPHSGHTSSTSGSAPASSGNASGNASSCSGSAFPSSGNAPYISENPPHVANVVPSSSRNALGNTSRFGNASLEPRFTVPLELQSELVRGLSRFHPRLTPVNLMALRRLAHGAGIELQSVDKALLIQTLIRYGDQQLFLQGLDIVHAMPGGPIPVGAIMRAVQFAYTGCHLRCCQSLWRYIQQHYLLQLPQYTALMADLMRTFARAPDYRDLAREVAEACLPNAGNPVVAASIAKVAYVRRDRALARALLAAPAVALAGPVQGALVQLDAALGQSVPTAGLTGQEFSGVVKGVAERDVDAAEQLAAERPGERLATFALANQYIEERDFPRFRAALAELTQQQAVPGLLLNLRLKWELRHGTFYGARRHYQNWRHVPLRQRVIALNTLSALASADHERQWVANERRRLAAVRVREA